MQVNVGYFDTQAEAALAYDLVKVLTHGEDATTNFAISTYVQELQHRHEVLHPLVPCIQVLMVFCQNRDYFCMWGVKEPIEIVSTVRLHPKSFASSWLMDEVGLLSSR